MESQRHLLSAVGHDLRTPLTAMRINLEFVNDDELREGLLRNLDELQALTEQVLAAAKGAGGEQRRNVDLSALVEKPLHRPGRDRRTGQLGQPIPPRPFPAVPTEIKRAVRNLAEERRRLMATRRMSRIAHSGDGYDVVVEDDGPGISETDRQRVFEPLSVWKARATKRPAALAWA